MYNCISLLLILPHTPFTCPGAKGVLGHEYGVRFWGRGSLRGLERGSGSGRLSRGYGEQHGGHHGSRLSGDSAVSTIAR